jgi:DNA-binding MarR family transcriptional regulator
MRHSRKRARQSNSTIGTIATQIERDLSAIRRAMRQPLEEEYAKGNVTVPQKAAMQVVVQAPGVTLKELSLAISLAHSTVSGIVDRLEKRGLIERRQDPTDGRLTRIYPSAAVAEFVSKRIPALRSGPLGTALARAHPEERAKIRWALNRLRELLDAG